MRKQITDASTEVMSRSVTPPRKRGAQPPLPSGKRPPPPLPTKAESELRAKEEAAFEEAKRMEAAAKAQADAQAITALKTRYVAYSQDEEETRAATPTTTSSTSTGDTYAGSSSNLQVQRTDGRGAGKPQPRLEINLLPAPQSMAGLPYSAPPPRAPSALYTEGVFTVVDGHTAHSELGRAVCPDALQSIDRVLSISNSRPTIFFRLVQACSLLQAPHALWGSCFSPGMALAVASNDNLMGLVLLSVACLFLVFVFILEDLRRSIRPDGPLKELGAGSRMITEKQQQEIEGAMHKFYPARTPMKLKMAIVFIGLSAILVGGIGVQSPLHNRVSAMLLMCFFGFCNTLIAVWIISMRMASSLAGDAVGLVVTHVGSINSSSDLAAEWESDVYAPSVALADGTMRTLSNGWGRAVVSYCVMCLLGEIALFSLMLSPLALNGSSASWWPLVLRSGCGGGILMFARLPVFVASGPAHVSSQCDELMNSLNQLRLRLRTVAADSQISVLEKALRNLNQGQGLGFLVVRTVIDKGKLNRFARGVAGLVVTVGPIMLAWSETTTSSRAQQSSCTLSTVQEDSIKAVAETFINSACAYNVNLVIGPSPGSVHVSSGD